MRVDLKGIHSTHAKLADGSTKIYWYAWRGGPHLRGEPGSPDFIASYNEAMAQRRLTPEGKLQFLIDGYQQSGEFRTLRERTRCRLHQTNKDHRTRIRRLSAQGVGGAETRGVFMDWRDKLAVKSVRQADYAWTVLARILSWAKDRGKITVNPCERGGRLYNGTRVDFVWSIEDEAAFLKTCPRICICRSCSRCGPASGRAICCGFRGLL